MFGIIKEKNIELLPGTGTVKDEGNDWATCVKCMDPASEQEQWPTGTSTMPAIIIVNFWSSLLGNDNNSLTPNKYFYVSCYKISTVKVTPNCVFPYDFNHHCHNSKFTKVNLRLPNILFVNNQIPNTKHICNHIS